MTVMTAIGLMSGTSLDGIDIALVETDGETVRRFGPTAYYAYEESEQACLRNALKAAVTLEDRNSRPKELAEAEAVVTQSHRRAVLDFLSGHGLVAQDIDVIGFHGQTVLHRPERGLTVQIGDGDTLARSLSIPVVHDFRARDVEAGGQGAPLVPVFHRALVEMSRIERPVAIANIGGVSNVTFIGGDGQVSSFDTGPGNALLDDWMRKQTGSPFDSNGETASRGKADEVLLEKLLSHPFFRQPPPKSLDRNWIEHGVVDHLSIEDGAATLTAFTARSIGKSLDHAGFKPNHWIIAGGGARNTEMKRLLADYSGIEVLTADDVGWSSSFLEAQAFAFLAVRSLRGLPLTYPSTTGVSGPMTGGVLAPA